jgi:oxygen-independent coproporphyrinogen III oxidase
MPTLNRIPLADAIAQGAYQGYSYSYPHKTAYRVFDAPVPLNQVWKNEKLDALFFYMHVPFCEFRCGFCNLFTQANPADGLTQRYLKQIRIEAERTQAQLGKVQFARMAIGGGTPTFLECDELSQLFNIPQDVFNIDVREVPTSIEVSPPTITREKLQLLAEKAVDRISIGVQSFDDDEVHQLGRPQQANEVQESLELIGEFDFPVLNIDLIYGGETQTQKSWLQSVERAIEFSPAEVYLYPLYVRPLTGLGRLPNSSPAESSDRRLRRYRAARDLLISEGFIQSSMRMFSRYKTDKQDGPAYSCQADGMIGIGCGSRSYTTDLHYSTEYAVGHTEVRGILADYISRDADSFDSASFGHRISLEDQKRRYVIQSLLQVDGLDRADYLNRFQTDAISDFSEINELAKLGFASINNASIQLTASGIEQSDAIGPWLYSETVNRLMSIYELK